MLERIFSERAQSHFPGSLFSQRRGLSQECGVTQREKAQISLSWVTRCILPAQGSHCYLMLLVWGGRGNQCAHVALDSLEKHMREELSGTKVHKRRENIHRTLQRASNVHLAHDTRIRTTVKSQPSYHYILYQYQAYTSRRLCPCCCINIPRTVCVSYFWAVQLWGCTKIFRDSIFSGVLSLILEKTDKNLWEYSTISIRMGEARPEWIREQERPDLYSCVPLIFWNPWIRNGPMCSIPPGAYLSWKKNKSAVLWERRSNMKVYVVKHEVSQRC